MLRIERMIAGAAFVLVPMLLVTCGGEKQPSSDTAAATGSAAAVAQTTGPVSGEQIYQRCVTCHQANGEGTPGVYPPLAGSEYVTAANPAVPIRIVMHGAQGPITVKGTEFNGVMPQGGLGVMMTDEEIAAVVTYIRSSWGNNASAVTPQQVAAERTATAGRTGGMTAAELKPLM